MGLEIIEVVEERASVESSEGQKEIHRADTPQRVPEDHAKASFGMTYTKNLGNFESIKIFVSVTRPCPNTEEALTVAHEANRLWVEEKLGEVIEDVEKSL